jgi:hypothetical protein
MTTYAPHKFQTEQELLTSKVDPSIGEKPIIFSKNLTLKARDFFLVRVLKLVEFL